MRIEDYSFGRIVIDGKTYTRDLIIYPDRIDPSWWRKEGHLLQMEDLGDILKEKPEILIIGTGYSGVMTVPQSLIERLKREGIEVIARNTPQAVEIFNQMDKSRRIIAALHLTC